MQMKQPKVSIIVPCYNVEAYLPRCMDSLLGQTLKEIEIILVDDESPDRVPAMCDEYARQDSRVKVVHKPNGGLGFARNSGLDVATGEYVMFVDSDDYIDADACEWLAVCLDNRRWDAVYYSFETFTDRGDISGHQNSLATIGFEGTGACQAFMWEMVGALPWEKMERKYQVSACTVCYRRSVLEQGQVRFHSERELISEDLVFNWDFLLQARSIGYVPHSFYHYFKNTSSLTTKVRLDRIEKNEALYRYLWKKACRSSCDKEQHWRLQRLMLGYCRHAMLQVCKSALSSDEKNRWLREVCQLPVWKEIATEYPIRKLPWRYALFFYAKRYGVVWLIRWMGRK